MVANERAFVQRFHEVHAEAVGENQHKVVWFAYQPLDVQRVVVERRVGDVHQAVQRVGAVHDARSVANRVHQYAGAQ